MSGVDTGDVVMHRASKTQHTVACAHDGWLRTIGKPEHIWHEDSCDLVTQVTPEQRYAALQAMASSTATTHRPTCARLRLSQMEGLDE